MKCPRCQYENPADAAFCNECGARLEVACSACGEANRAGAKFCRKCGEPLAQPGVSGYAAAAKFGRLDEARRLGDRPIESSPSHPGYAADAQHLLGDIATHPDRFDAESGAAHYRQALALAEPRGMRPLVAHCHLGLGKLYRRTGKREQATEHFTTATAMYREMDMRFWLEQAEAVNS